MKTIEINNKHYIDAKVVMIDTDRTENCLISNGINLSYHKQYFTKEYLSFAKIKAYHLYITSNEEIKEGDYFVYPTIKGLSIAKHDYSEDITPTNLKGVKVIATTDSSLKCFGKGIWENQPLPQPSKEFIQSYIESYNNKQVIEDILVEVELYIKRIYLEGSPRYNLKLKDNTIIIKEKEDGWDDLWELWRSTVTENVFRPSDFIIFLKENYNPPTKK